MPENESTVYYLVNFHYGELKIAVGYDELNKIKESKDGWETVPKEAYDKYQRMYDAGAAYIRSRIMAFI